MTIAGVVFGPEVSAAMEAAITATEVWVEIIVTITAIAFSVLPLSLFRQIKDSSLGK